MSPLLLRRLRGIAGTVATWATAAGLVGALGGAVISLAILLPRGQPMQFGNIVTGMGIAGAIVGGICGLGFALTLLLGERRRDGVAELRGWRMSAWGALPCFAFGLLASRDIGVATAFASMGAVAAAGSLALARRAALESGAQAVPLLADER